MSKKDGVLYLPTKLHWLEMIGSGIKIEEYRELKPYWKSRLTDGYDKFIEYEKAVLHCYGRYLNVYADIIDIRVGYPNPEWTDEPGKKVFIIVLDGAYIDLPF